MALKVIRCGDVIEVYEYEHEPYIPDKRNDKDPMTLYLLTGEEKYLEGLNRPKWLTEAMKRDKRRSNGNAARSNFRRLVLANFTGQTNFVTLTFRDGLTDRHGDPIDIQSVEQSNKLFDQFMKRLRRAYGVDFKYTVVIEFQDKSGRGAVHYHMLADLGITWSSELECRAIERDFAQSLWKNGFVDLKDVEHVDNLGAYMSKYMTKRMDDQRLAGKKAYRTSQNLIRPEILRGEIATKLIEDYRLSQKKEVYANTYISEYLGQISYKEYNLKRL